jgi:hypothetical protein
MTMQRQKPSWIRFARGVAGVILLMPVAAGANESALNAHALGVAESMLKFCARVDAPDSGKWRQQAKQISQGTPEAVVARIRTTEEYRAAYASVTNFVGKVAPQNVKRACIVPPAQNK